MSRLQYFFIKLLVKVFGFRVLTPNMLFIMYENNYFVNNEMTKILLYFINRKQSYKVYNIIRRFECYDNIVFYDFLETLLMDINNNNIKMIKFLFDKFPNVIEDISFYNITSYITNHDKFFGFCKDTNYCIGIILDKVIKISNNIFLTQYRINSIFRILIKYKSIGNLEIFLNNKDFNPSYNKNILLKYCIDMNCIPIIDMLLKHPKINLDFSIIIYCINENKYNFLEKFLGMIDFKHVSKYDKYYLFNDACVRGFTNVVKILLDDGRFDPSLNANYIIRHNFSYTKEIIDMIKNDTRVRCKKKYPKYLKPSYEKRKIIRTII